MSAELRPLPPLTLVPAGSTLHFRYLAEGGRWFDDETVIASDGQDVAITV